MKVVFLCGGVGKRMMPLMEDKFLFKFLGKTLLEYHIDMAKNFGLKEFVVIANDENVDRIKKIVDENTKVLVQKNARGMADALLTAEKLLRGDEIIVVSPNDVFEPKAYENLLKEAEKGNATSYLTGHVVKEYFPGGYIIEENGFMKGIIEKPKNPPSNLVNIVLHLHKDTKKLFDYMKSTDGDDDVYEKAIDRMIKDGEKIRVVHYDGYWQAIKYPWHVLLVLDHFMEGVKRKISPSAEISESAKIYGNVIIEDNVRVLDNAVIRGPAYIGKNSVIGNNALVWSGTQIGENCVVGFSTEIKHSYIGDRCWFHTNYIGDSIIGDGCSFGAGTITANLRFDEKEIKMDIRGEKIGTGMKKFGAVFGENCRTGIHVGTMPGVKVGPNSIIGPNVCLREDLEPNKIIFENGKIIDNKIKLDERNLSKLIKKLGG